MPGKPGSSLAEPHGYAARELGCVCGGGGGACTCLLLSVATCRLDTAEIRQHVSWKLGVCPGLLQLCGLQVCEPDPSNPSALSLRCTSCWPSRPRKGQLGERNRAKRRKKKNTSPLGHLGNGGWAGHRQQRCPALAGWGGES